MDSFFTTNVVNWLPMLYVFANLRTFHDNHASMENYGHFLSPCLDNCTQFPEPHDCIAYCHTVQEMLDKSNTVDPLHQCRDWRCCKNKAGTNDYAYIRCMEGVRSLRTFQPFPNAITTVVFFLFFLFVMVMWFVIVVA
jgi:hypothetical protein